MIWVNDIKDLDIKFMLLDSCLEHKNVTMFRHKYKSETYKIYGIGLPQCNFCNNYGVVVYLVNSFHRIKKIYINDKFLYNYLKKK